MESFFLFYFHQPLDLLQAFYAKVDKTTEHGFTSGFTLAVS